MYEQTCHPRIESSVENRICVLHFVQISDVYPIKIHFWKWLRSDTKNRISRGFLYLHMYKKFQSVSDVSKILDFCASVNAASGVSTVYSL